MGQKRCYFKKQSGEAAENKATRQKTKLNKPKNKAEKLLKTRSCGKNKAKNKATDVVENK
jgi:hypothetical protein